MSDSTTTTPHIALIPSSGMGHLTPFLRLVATLTTNKKCQLTLITMHPTVSLAESQLISHFLSSFPQISYKQFHLLPFDTSTANSQDPFFLQFESIRRSAHLLSPLLSSSSPPFAAVITDITLASAFLPITTILSIPNYLLFTSSARMLSFLAHFPFIDDISSMQEIQIPGSSSWPIPKSWIPQPLNDPTNLFSTQFIENGKKIIESSGILVNTFNSLEPESLVSLHEGKVVNGLPPVITIGPLVPCDFERVGSPLKWLDDQADGSVVYVSFGSRTAMPREQIKEVGVGLVRSGCRFMWVVKDKKVDREDEEGVEEVLGSELMEQLKEKGLVVKSWVDQMAILSHSAVGGFLSHCGWNSVTEAAWNGVRMLAWPQGGDQRINAEVVEKSGLGRWVKSWGWSGEEVVGAEEIANRVKEIMADEGLRAHAANVRDEARKAVGAGGSSEQGLLRFVENVGKVGTMLNFSYQASQCFDDDENFQHLDSS